MLQWPQNNLHEQRERRRRPAGSGSLKGPPEIRMAAQSLVTIKHLKARPKINGAVGIVYQEISGVDRVRVKLTGAKAFLSLQACNLEVLDAEAAESFKDLLPFFDTEVRRAIFAGSTTVACEQRSQLLTTHGCEIAVPQLLGASESAYYTPFVRAAVLVTPRCPGYSRTLACHPPQAPMARPLHTRWRRRATPPASTTTALAELALRHAEQREAH